MKYLLKKNSFYYNIRYLLGKKKKSIYELFEHILFKKSLKQSILPYRDKYKGKRCFIIGNGPSLNSMNLNLMKDDFVFCSNSFFLKFQNLDFKPNIITVEDHLVAEDNKRELEDLDEIIKIFPFDLRKTIVKDSNTIWIELRRAFKNINKEKTFKFNTKSEIFYWGGTVLYMNLQLAAYMGFKEIYLIGVDLSYNIPKDAIINGSVITSQSDDPNHFDPVYFGKGKRWHIPETERMQVSFSTAYRELNKNGVKLFNATKGGNLQEIPRVNYKDLFNV
jgi:hypothetical protein